MDILAPFLLVWTVGGILFAITCFSTRTVGSPALKSLPRAAVAAITLSPSVLVEEHLMAIPMPSVTLAVQTALSPSADWGVIAPWVVVPLAVTFLGFFAVGWLLNHRRSLKKIDVQQSDSEKLACAASTRNH